MSGVEVLSGKESAASLGLLLDLDNVLGLSARGIIEWSNTWAPNAPLTIEKYSENFPAMWGVSLEEANERWAEFCRDHMPGIAPDESMQRIIEGLPEVIKRNILTSRGSHTVEVTRHWAEQHYRSVGKVLHGLTDWANDPLAHTRTKADSLQHYVETKQVGLPDICVDDEPKHTGGLAKFYADRGVNPLGHVVLYGAYPWNEHARDRQEGVIWLPTPGLFEEFIHEAIAEKQKAA